MFTTQHPPAELQDDDTPSPPEVSPMDSAQARRAARQAEVLADPGQPMG